MESRKSSKSIRELVLWQKAHEMVLEIYRVTKDFREERYGLAYQIRRSSVSMATSITEAFEKRRATEKIRIMKISRHALLETEHHLVLADSLEYSKMNLLMSMADEFRWMLDAYVEAIRRGR